MDYYTDSATHPLQACVTNASSLVQTSSSFAILFLFKILISLYGQKSSSGGGPFGLTNRDFGAHNLLVNNDFEIMGVIDFDIVMAAPTEVVAQYPQFTGLDREPSGYVATKPLAIDRIKSTEPKLEEYKNLPEVAEARMMGGSSKNREASLPNMMLSNAPSVVQGLLEYQSPKIGERQVDTRGSSEVG